MNIEHSVDTKVLPHALCPTHHQVVQAWSTSCSPFWDITGSILLTTMCSIMQMQMKITHLCLVCALVLQGIQCIMSPMNCLDYSPLSKLRTK